ncbi:MAG: hypothetical protein OEM28_04090 [Nitrosopumilus sp.]|nr:hypothetical protein [Nitrosopumilus sp.]MDH3487632.1 hypothetical protein [Nitrosopumilus sp.]
MISKIIKNPFLISREKKSKEILELFSGEKIIIGIDEMEKIFFNNQKVTQRKPQMMK